jgi:DNA invertase Pin-like site-specific DNA recombinase
MKILVLKLLGNYYAYVIAKMGGWKMAVLGYARVSTNGQTLASQDAQLMAAGCAKVYAEKVSGAKTDRPELAKLLRRLDRDDVLVVTRLDRLARSTRDLLNILDVIAKLAPASSR